jgi:glyoxylase-like metal-dependent hydrolase (beta-lactamase superfamily II)
VSVRIEHLVTSGTFSLDGQTFDVDNNVWLLGDDSEVIVFDAPHDPDAIEAAVGDRTVVAIACTHAHDDHVRCAPELAERLSTPVLLHPDDRVLWDLVHARHEPDGACATAGARGRRHRVDVLHTPGTRPARSASRCPTSASSSPATRCSPAGPGRPGGRTRPTDDPRLDPHAAVRAAAETAVLTGHGPRRPWPPRRRRTTSGSAARRLTGTVRRRTTGHALRDRVACAVPQVGGDPRRPVRSRCVT